VGFDSGVLHLGLLCLDFVLCLIFQKRCIILGTGCDKRNCWEWLSVVFVGLSTIFALGWEQIKVPDIVIFRHVCISCEKCLSGLACPPIIHASVWTYHLSTHWTDSYILFIIIIGGILVLVIYIYITRLASNEIF